MKHIYTLDTNDKILLNIISNRCIEEGLQFHFIPELDFETDEVSNYRIEFENRKVYELIQQAIEDNKAIDLAIRDELLVQMGMTVLVDYCG